MQIKRTTANIPERQVGNNAALPSLYVCEKLE